MSIKSGTPLLYVTNSGQIQQVTAMSADQGGVVDVQLSNGLKTAVSSLNLFNSQAAANIAANNRLNAKSKVELPQIYR